MEIAVVAIGLLLRNLTGQLVGEFTMEKRMRKGLKSLVTKLMLMQATLDGMASVSLEQPEGVNIWAEKAWELSYQMEDIVDAIMLHVKDAGEPASPKKMRVKKLLKKSTRFFKRSKDLRQISDALEDAICLSKELADQLRQTYGLEIQDGEVDPPVMALYTDVAELIGIEDSRDKLINILTEGDDWSKQPLKTVSIVGFGGLGKTTLAKAAYDEIKGQFDCSTFVSVSQNPDIKDVFQNILFGFDKNKYAHIRDKQHLINKLIHFLNGKRYLIVIDNIWDESLWGIIKNAFSNNNNLGSRIITTTRIISVSKACCSSANDSIYQMEPLSDDDSSKLLYARIFGSLSRYPPEFELVSNDILKKCGGVPAAIIAMASVLAHDPEMKTKDQWHALLKSNGHGILEDSSTADMQKILCLSYYDLPLHLRICLLYLSTFPGTHPIEKHRLVKKLVAEGKVSRETKLIITLNKKEAKLSLEEAASQYLNELVNRNVIQPLECNNNGEVITYHIHPMMHDFLKAIAEKIKFAASLDGKDISRLLLNPHGMNFHHLSIDCPDSESLTDLSSMAFDGGARSLTVFGHANRILLRHFEGVRILDLEGCKSIERPDLEYICSIVRLKQLCLAKTDITELPPQIGSLQLLEGLDVQGTQITQLPAEIGNLQYLKRLYLGGTQITQLPPQIFRLQRLETLDARKSRVKDLPDQVVRLTRLVHLLIGDNESCEGVKLPDGIGKMISLQQLGTIDLRICSASSLKELGELPYLKQIEVLASDEPEDTRLNNALLSSLDKSTELRSLVVYSDFRLSTMHSSSSYKWLNCRKKLTVVRRSLKVPISIAGHHFLRKLDIRVCKLEEDDLKILRELPRLHSLIVRLDVPPTKMIRISCEGFAKLESLYVDCRMPRVIFEEGAMPKLEQLELKLYGGSANEEHMRINHLLNLEKVTLRYYKWYATNKGVKETTDDMRKEAKEHQNEITLCVAEEDKDGNCTMETEIFQENRVASSSKMTEIVKGGDTKEGRPSSEQPCYCQLQRDQ